MVAVTLSTPQVDNLPGELGALTRDWLRSLRAERKSPATIRAYGYGLAAFGKFLARAGMPTDPVNISAEHIREFLIDEAERNSPTTSNLRRTYLSVFFRWLVDEGEVKVNPVSRIKTVKVQDRPPDVLRDAEWTAMLATCNGPSLDDRRDTAILLTLESSGLRRSECASLRIRDVDVDAESIVVVGKGDRIRVAAISTVAVTAIRRYLRKRPDGGKDPDGPLWLARGGQAMTHDGIAGVVRRRSAQAGLRVHAHQLRHRFAHEMKSQGMSDENLMSLGGWKSRETMAGYARQTTSDRALEAYRKIRGDS